jgi:hypothetical protein
MHRMQPQRRMTGDFETSYGLDDIQGTFFEISPGEVAAAAAAAATAMAMATAEGHGSERDEVSGGVEEEEDEDEEEVRQERNVEEGEDERTERAPDNDNDYDDPEAWRQRIDLRAVECCEVGVQLNAPPFPFHQKWDLQDQERRKKLRKESKKRKRAEESGRAGEKRRSSPDYTIGGSAWKSGR